MKTFFSSSYIRATIGLAMATALVLLSYPFANIFFGKSLNTPWYFVILFSLSGATIVLGWLQALGKASAMRQDSDETQTQSSPLEEYYSDLAHRIKSQYRDSPLKVTMDVNGTPITIESNDASKVEDIVKHLAQSMQASNLAEAKASHFYVREDTETYRTENNPE